MSSVREKANPPPLKRRPNLTSEEKTEIIALREKGWGLERLAEKFECHVGSISWCCLMAGVSAPRRNEQKKINNTDPRPEYMRNGRRVRRFSADEDKLIQEMRERGETLAAICRATGRQHNSIIGRLCGLARRDETGDSPS
jgi:transposase-like protein